MGQQFMNVREKWFYYDTILVSPWVALLSHPIPGWFSSFAQIATADSLTFFNARNKAIGLSYNNQEARDQLPFALVAETVSLGFFGPATSSLYGTPCTAQPVKGRVDFLPAWGETEVPQHTSCVFKTNQDERLKINCAMVPPSYGPVGTAIGQGDTSATINGQSASTDTAGMGTAHLKYRWEFAAGGIGIPRRATMSVEIRFTEWVKAWLAGLWGPGNVEFATAPTPTYVQIPSAFMIQCMVTGRREVQQRGEYHA
jgi:hypothetical protein